MYGSTHLFYAPCLPAKDPMHCMLIAAENMGMPSRSACLAVFTFAQMLIVLQLLYMLSISATTASGEDGGKVAWCKAASSLDHEVV